MIYITDFEHLNEIASDIAGKKAMAIKAYTKKDKIVCLKDDFSKLNERVFRFIRYLDAQIYFIDKGALEVLVATLQNKNISYETELAVDKDAIAVINDIFSESPSLNSGGSVKPVIPAGALEKSLSMPMHEDDSRESEFVPEVAVEKKKRGRKPGSKNKKTLLKEGIVEVSSEETVIKKTDEEAAEYPIKKKRGRKPGSKNKKTLLKESLDTFESEGESLENKSPEELANFIKETPLNLDNDAASDTEETSEEDELTLIDKFCNNSKNKVLKNLSKYDKECIKDAINSSFDYYVNFRIMLSGKLSRRLVDAIFKDLEPLYKEIKSM